MSGAGLVPASLAAVSAVFAIASVAGRADPGILTRLGSRASGGPNGAGVRRVLSAIGGSAPGRLVAGLGSAPSEAGAWTAEEIAGAKALAVGAAIVLPVALPAPLWPLVLLLAVLGYRAPDLVLARKERRRRVEASREVPVFLDLLAVATSAGLPPQLAVAESVLALRGPLGHELREAVRSVELGGRWRDELEAAARRLTLPELTRVVAVLARSERLGSTLAGEVTRLASDVRGSRRAAATERARTAPVKMLFPLVFLILPAFLLLTVVPVLVTTVRSMG